MIIKGISELQNGTDVRGIAVDSVKDEPVNLTSNIVMKIAYAFSLWLQQKTGKEKLTLAVGRDSRITGPDFVQATCLSFICTGNTVYDCGLATTPSMFMTTVDPEMNCDGAVMITASHLPSNRNGMKFFTREGGVEKEELTEILALAETVETAFGQGGQRIAHNFLQVYAANIVGIIREKTRMERPLEGAHIVVDAGNGAGGFFVKDVLEVLGANTEGSQFLNPDGNFPNHIPNPEDKDAMASARQAVLDNQADMGIIFDTDVDRAAVIDEKGQPINRNGFIAFIAHMLLTEYPGTTIVTDSVTSTGLTEYIEALGGIHHRFKRGYKNVINEAKRLNAEGVETHLAMETSGHGAIKENYFLDDGAYLVTMALIQYTTLHHEGKPLSDFLSALKEPAESTEVRFKITEEDFKAYGQSVLDDFAAFAKEQPGWTIVSPNYEGVRVACDPSAGNGWCLLRLSLHEPVMPLNIESDDEDGCEKIKAVIDTFIAKYDGLK